MDLDLHGVRHRDAEVLAEEHVLLHRAPFKIITGCSTRMKEIVIKILDKHKYQYADGMPNPGVITVLSE